MEGKGDTKRDGDGRKEEKRSRSLTGRRYRGGGDVGERGWREVEEEEGGGKEGRKNR